MNTDERIRAEAINWRENISHYMRADQGPVAVDRAIALGRQQTLATLLYHLLGD